MTPGVAPAVKKKVDPYTPLSFAKDVGSLAALTPAFEAPFHMHDAYATARQGGQGVGGALRSAGRSVGTRAGLAGLAGRSLDMMKWMLKAGPKWGLALGAPLTGLLAYASLKRQGKDATLQNMGGAIGTQLEEQGQRFGQQVGEHPSMNRAIANTLRGYFFDPLGGLAYTYQRGRRALGGES
jgi:hypothetical protein